MSELVIKKFSSPDERRPFAAHGYADILEFDQGSVGMAVFEPGWKWSQDVRPIAGTESCQVAHSAYCISGKMVVQMNDGTREELGPGDMAVIPPGHDAWVVGNESCVLLDFQGMGTYAQAREPSRESREVATQAPGVH